MIQPELKPTSALFLDLDGTLLEIAADPAQVVVPAALPDLLADVHRLLGGAVAVVSGRVLNDIDRLLWPFAGCAGAEHGGSLRFEDGSLHDLPPSATIPDDWYVILNGAVRPWPGVRIEPKPHGVTVHYRQAPERREDVWQLMRALVPEDHPDFRLLPARKAVEIAARGVSKGLAVERLMGRDPFRGRVPVFIGDDVTDEAGMAAARALGGHGLRVAEAFGGEPAAVRAWLQREADLLRRQPVSRAGQGEVSP